MAGFWNKVGGHASNALARGSVYNSTTGQYAPGGVRTQRMIQGGMAQMGPLASLAGQFWGRGWTDRAPEAVRFDRGLQVAPQVLPSGWREGQLQGGSVSVPNVGMGGGGLAGLALGGYSPMAGAPVGQGSMDAAIDRGIQQGQDAMSARAQGKLDAAFNGMPAGSAPMGGGWVSGGGGARGAFSTGGFANPKAREASIAATQQALQESQNQTPNNRQLTNSYF